MRKAILAMTMALTLATGQLHAATRKAPTADVGAGRIAWFDITTTNLAQSKEFYGKLFDWQFTRCRAPIGGRDRRGRHADRNAPRRGGQDQRVQRRRLRPGDGHPGELHEGEGARRERSRPDSLSTCPTAAERSPSSSIRPATRSACTRGRRCPRSQPEAVTTAARGAATRPGVPESPKSPAATIPATAQASSLSRRPPRCRRRPRLPRARPRSAAPPGDGTMRPWLTAPRAATNAGAFAARSVNSRVPMPSPSAPHALP